MSDAGAKRAALPPQKSIVLVGLMGAGKTSIGDRMAKALGIPFVDADSEVELAAGCSIEEIFERIGEEAFRDGERRVIKRLLEDSPKVLATGGGAFMDPDTRDVIAELGISIWLRADLDLLVERTSRRDNRPLLKTGDPREILENLIAERHPVYEKADIIVDVTDEAPMNTTNRVIAALLDYLETAEGVGAAE